MIKFSKSLMFVIVIMTTQISNASDIFEINLAAAIDHHSKEFGATQSPFFAAWNAVTSFVISGYFEKDKSIKLIRIPSSATLEKKSSSYFLILPKVTDANPIWFNLKYQIERRLKKPLPPPYNCKINLLNDDKYTTCCLNSPTLDCINNLFALGKTHHAKIGALDIIASAVVENGATSVISNDDIKNGNIPSEQIMLVWRLDPVKQGGYVVTRISPGLLEKLTAYIYWLSNELNLNGNNTRYCQMEGGSRSSEWFEFNAGVEQPIRAISHRPTVRLTAAVFGNSIGLQMREKGSFLANASYANDVLDEEVSSWSKFSEFSINNGVFYNCLGKEAGKHMSENSQLLDDPESSSFFIHALYFKLLFDKLI